MEDPSSSSLPTYLEEEEDSKDDEEKEKDTTLVVIDDAKSVWTAEEDLRLLDAISTFGLGNWADISEALSNGGSLSSPEGSGSDVNALEEKSVTSSSASGGGKSARRCMERYCDDFLGRYGHILPPYTIVPVGDDQTDDLKKETSSFLSKDDTCDDTQEEQSASTHVLERKRKRPQTPPQPTTPPQSQTKKSNEQPLYQVIPTTSLSNYNDFWPYPHLPLLPNNIQTQLGDEVGRDISFKLEQSYIKATNASNA
eukprot:2683235-Ditylum_brightwellii.AAC.1